MTGSGMRPLCLPCGEQGKLSTAQEIHLAGKGHQQCPKKNKRAPSCRSSTSGVKLKSSARYSTQAPRASKTKTSIARRWERRRKSSSATRCWKATATAKRPGDAKPVDRRGRNTHGKG